jgi:lysophospholipase L1-like esterase
MKKLLLVTVIPALLAVIAFQNGGGDASAEGPPIDVTPEYLALGDSLAVGVGASDPATTGYVPRFHGYVRDALDPGNADPEPLAFVPDAFNSKFLKLANLSVGGETSGSMILGGQLDDAVEELTTRNGNATPVDDVRVVTLDIGGNDMFAVVPVCSDGLTPECTTAIRSLLATFSANFDFILGELRSAAGPNTTIVVMTYYNALVNPGCQFNPLASLADVILEGDPSLGLPLGLNDLIRLIAVSHDARVAETFGVLGPADVQPDCRHANDGGYEAIADEFIAAFDS